MKNPIEITPGLHWVGALHPELRVFDDLFPTEHGTTYNSYLVQGSEKTALIDTVKIKFVDQFMDTIRSLPTKSMLLPVNPVYSQARGPQTASAGMPGLSAPSGMGRLTRTA